MASFVVLAVLELTMQTMLALTHLASSSPVLDSCPTMLGRMFFNF